jgi:hypothetical protein
MDRESRFRIARSRDFRSVQVSGLYDCFEIYLLSDYLIQSMAMLVFLYLDSLVVTRHLLC